MCFQIACQSEYEPRAKELIEMTALPSLLSLAIKYASKLGRIHLAEKLGDLLPQFEEQEKEREKYDENDAASELLLSTPTNAQNLIRSNQGKSTPSIVPVCFRPNIFLTYFGFTHFICKFSISTTRNPFQLVRSNVIRSKRRQQAVERRSLALSSI